jgi:hypothetical protein
MLKGNVSHFFPAAEMYVLLKQKRLYSLASRERIARNNEGISHY